MSIKSATSNCNKLPLKSNLSNTVYSKRWVWLGWVGLGWVGSTVPKLLLFYGNYIKMDQKLVQLHDILTVMHKITY